MTFSKVWARQKTTVNTDKDVFVLVKCVKGTQKNNVHAMSWARMCTQHVNQTICVAAERWLKMPAALLTCCRRTKQNHTVVRSLRQRVAENGTHTHTMHSDVPGMHRYKPHSFVFTLAEVRSYSPFTSVNQKWERVRMYTPYAGSEIRYNTYYHYRLSNRIPRLAPYLNIQTRDLL